MNIKKKLLLIFEKIITFGLCGKIIIDKPEDWNNVGKK